VTDSGALAAVAARRSQTYWLLSRLFHERPTPPFLAELEETLGVAPPDARAPLANELAALSDAVRRARAVDPQAVELAVEFTRLFGGLEQQSGVPPPYESVVREGRLLGDTTAAVAVAYAEAGFGAVLPDAGPADHLAAELRFLALLAYREREAWLAGDQGGASDWLERTARFLDEHLLVWLPDHGAAIARAAREPFYAAAARLAVEACRLDRADVGNLLEAASARPAA
jgi:TorA maturation chaperone TorD